MVFFFHVACSGIGHLVIEIFIKRSNSSCLQCKIRGFDTFCHEITSCEDFEDSCYKKGIENFFCFQVIASSLSSLAVRIILQRLLPPE